MRRLMVCVMGVTIACGGGSEPAGIAASPPVDTLLTVSMAPTVAAGGTIQPNIGVYPPGKLVWSSETPSVATVAGDGRITGLTPGTATVRATYGSRSASVTFDVFDPAFVSLSVDNLHACGVTASRAMYCWGATDDVGRVGRVETCRPHGFEAKCSTSPQRNMAALPFAKVSKHGGTCGLTEAGEAYCWGTVAVGHPAEPRKVGGDVRFTMVETGGTACGLDATGIAYCWGYEFAGNLGAPATGTCGTDNCSPSPVAITGNRVYKAISVGAAHACALEPDGTAWCWGWNGAGQLGNGKLSVDNPPVYRGESEPVKVETDLRFAAIDAGQYNTCALTASGQAYCWGRNTSGQLGIGRASTTPSLVPVAVTAGLTFASITVGANHICGLTPNGGAYCWGSNGGDGDNAGALGDGTTETRSIPTRVAGNLVFVELQTRRNATCGRVASGRVYCWGSNLYGQLGIGSIIETNSTTPAGVGGVP